MGIEETRKLYIRLPVKIVDTLQIKALHPDILEVHLPRQKSRRWCFITVGNQGSLEKLKEDLQKVRINNKKIIIGTYKKHKLVEKQSNHIEKREEEKGDLLEVANRI